jgi:hypothetical protein
LIGTGGHSANEIEFPGNGILSKFDSPGPTHLRQFTEIETFQALELRIVQPQSGLVPRKTTSQDECETGRLLLPVLGQRVTRCDPRHPP